MPGYAGHCGGMMPLSFSLPLPQINLTGDGLRKNSAETHNNKQFFSPVLH